MFGPSGTLTKLFECPSYKPTDCLNGMRVLSMFWIILGHTFLMPSGVSGYQNQEDIVMSPLNSDAAETSPWMQLIFAAEAGVDTFFFLSGFLLAFLTLKEIRAGRFNGFYGIILRYIRLTPSLALTMMVFYKIWVYFGNGPFAVSFQKSINRRCDGSWWSELTYTMNFIPFDSDKVCMGWTWYLGDDMIFFIISMFLLPLYHKTKAMGWIVVLSLTGISFGVTTYFIVRHHLGVYVFDHHYTDYSYWAYSKPYSRIPAYFVGIGAAWLLDDLEKKGITRESRPVTAAAMRYASLAAFVAFAVIVFIIFISLSDFGWHKDSWKDLANIIYINLARPLWAACYAVITLLCYFGYLPRVDGFLSLPCWTPLARLTYGAYLVHPLVIKLAAGRAWQFYTFGGMDITYRWMGNLVLAFSGSILLWVLVERPCMTIFSPARKSRKGDASSPTVPDASEASRQIPQRVSLPQVHTAER